jgi:hypothetical protein
MSRGKARYKSPTWHANCQFFYTTITQFCQDCGFQFHGGLVNNEAHNDIEDEHVLQEESREHEKFVW